MAGTAKKTDRVSEQERQEQKVTAEATAALVGRKVVKVRYMDADEAREFGWANRPLVIQFDDQTIIYAACDEESNDAGVLFLEAPPEVDLCFGRFRTN